jgi:hypothetical protein
MSSRLRFTLLPAVVCALLFTGCATTPMSRVDANRGLYESWPIEIQEAVSSGRVVKGMTPEQVEMALGKPSKVEQRTAGANGDEIWIYGGGGGGGSSILNNTSISLGGGLGGVGIGTGPIGGGRRSSAEEREVVFANGVVIRADN